MSAAGSEALRRRDAEARTAAQREFATPLVLEAGAGTGKTATLVARVVAWCLGPGWERSQRELQAKAVTARDATPERVAARVLGRTVAITFTEAAAAEMATRVDAALLEIERGGLPIGSDVESLPEAPRRAERARWLRGALDHLVVQTIHAWCRRLLAAHPLEAGLHPRLDVDADGSAQAAVVREVLDGRLRHAYGPDGDPRFLALAARGYAPHELEMAMVRLLELGLPARALGPDPLADVRIRELGARLRAAVAAIRDAAGGALVDGGATEVTREAGGAIEALHVALDALPETRADLETLLGVVRESFQDRAQKRLQALSRGTAGTRDAAILGPRLAALADPLASLHALVRHLHALDLVALEEARPLLRELLGEVESELRRRGVLTFNALLTEASDLLTTRPEVARAVRDEIDQLLVDEFQDTDRRQCAIVAAIALAGPADERPGLFLVGDPKQSIYGWRSADLAAYEGFVAQAVEAGGTRHRLAVNHRSVPAILEEVERVIAPVMVREEGVQPEFQRLVASAERESLGGFASGGHATVEYWVSAAWDAEARAARVPTGAGEATAVEARALANDLRALHTEHGVPWSDVGVLFRSRGDWDVYLGALREAGVPFAVEGDRSYYRRREVIDASAWVRCVLDPGDVLALLTVLRSAPVGVPDAALIPLWTRRFPALAARLPDAHLHAELRTLVAAVVEALPTGVPGLERLAGWEANLLAALDAIARLRGSFEEEAADLFVERLRETVLLEATEAARYLGAWRVANLERFFDGLASELAAGAERGEVLRRLRHAVAEEEPTEEGQPRDLAPDAVNVLTLHGAKGLDFEHVYLMQLHKGPANRPSEAAYAERSDGVAEYRLFGAASLGWDLVDAERARVEAAERVRTLYVGMTRARSRLVVAGLWPEFQTRHNDAHVALLARRDPPPPDALGTRMVELAQRGEDRLDAADARWVFPALAPEEAEPIAVAAPSALPDPAAVRAESLALQVAAEAAERRMTRPLGATASAASVLAGPQSDEATLASLPESAGVPTPGAGPGSAPGSDPELARFVGTAIHRVLETFDLEADLDTELARQHDALGEALRPIAPPDRFDACLEAARDLLASVGRGTLLAELREGRAQVVARELPLLTAPEGDEGALAFTSGTVDLLLRDPDDPSGWVVVDYKTDHVADPAALADHAHRYAAQAAVYGRAVRESFGLAQAPRFELWFLAHDVRVALSASGASPEEAPHQLRLTLD